jgi:hypothetical protein
MVVYEFFFYEKKLINYENEIKPFILALYLRDYNVKNAHVLSYDRIVISEG